MQYIEVTSGEEGQKREEQSKIKSEECDRDYSESDSYIGKEEQSL